MERKNRTENDIIDSSQSRFSQEERARMASEHALGRRAAQGSKKNSSLGRTVAAPKSGAKSESTASKKKTTGKRSSSAGGSHNSASSGSSRNERVKSSSAKRKKDRKRQNYFILAMLFVLVVALIGVLSAFLLKINTVEVTGSEKYNSEEVLTAAGLETGDSMLLINANTMEEKIKFLLPYVENAEIKRVWPDKISVILEDAKPSLAIDTGKGYILLNNDCKVLEDSAAVVGVKCALIKGVSVESAEPGKTVVFSERLSTDDFVKLTKELEENEITDISCFDLTSISSIVITIDHRIEVRLGTLAGAVEKFRFGKRVIEETIASDKKHAMLIDITDDGKAYVRAKDDNNVNFGEISTEATTENATTEEITTVLNSVG